MPAPKTTRKQTAVSKPAPKAKTAKSAESVETGKSGRNGMAATASKPGKPGKPENATPAAKQSAPESSGEAWPRPGQKAPDFKLADDTGRSVSLADFKGKKVVLYFYPKDSTPGCTVEACDFRDNLNRLTRTGAVVLGVSADSVASHKKFKEKQGLNFPLLSDPDHRTIEAYGAWQEKSLYGRKFMGIVRSTFIIDGDGRIATVFPKVKVSGHVDEVLAALG